MSDLRGDELLERVVAELRRPVALSPDFDARVMAALEPPSPWTAPLRWLTRPRTVTVSPLGLLGAAACLAGLVVAGAALATRALRVLEPPPQVAVAPAPGPRAEVVRFVLAAPGARRVSVIGDFNDWDAEATPLRPAAAGVWVADVALPPGRHEYAFLIDGREWRADPIAPRAPANEYGVPNSVITVGARSS